MKRNNLKKKESMAEILQKKIILITVKYLKSIV